jgi:hypothetical protein
VRDLPWVVPRADGEPMAKIGLDISSAGVTRRERVTALLLL